MTAYIFLNGEFLLITEAMEKIADQLKEERENRRLHTDHFR